MEVLMPLQATSGAASYDAFGGGVAAVPNYIEDVFSTWLYTGNSSTQTITNGIDLTGKGGLVWFKRRNGAGEHSLFDTARGATKYLQSQATSAEATNSTSLTSFNANGFSLGNNGLNNFSGETFASWTFREQPKFFDVVTYTGNGVAGRTVAHNLGSVPGVMIVKCTSAAEPWYVYHRSLGATKHLTLNTTDAENTSDEPWNNTAPTATEFTLAPYSSSNGSGKTYVAYLFAHNAGGFGLTGTDNVISCGSYTGNGSTNGPVINLGYEPQWLLLKNASSAIGWYIVDNMRGFPNGASLFPDDNVAESNALSSSIQINATGFTITQDFSAINANGSTYIYIAIRRGPMAVPTTGTSVFSANATSAATGTAITTSFPVDLQVWSARASSLILNRSFIDRLRGAGTLTTDSNSPYLLSPSTAAEATDYGNTRAWSNTGFSIADVFGGINSIYWNFRRAPGFFDEVCWSGNDVAPRNISHNLTVIPEMMIVKSRTNAAGNWIVYHKNLPSALYYLSLNNTDAQATGTNVWRSTAPTASVFTVGNDSWVNTSGDTFINYLFASCPGVSKVAGYTGNGGQQSINCGFAAGARFVLIKRTDSAGDWYVWDTARGMVSGTNPYLLLNSTAAEVNPSTSCRTNSNGFTVNQTSGTNINVSSATYIFLAIA
jgi:hypothetical protein